MMFAHLAENQRMVRYRTFQLRHARRRSVTIVPYIASLRDTEPPGDTVHLAFGFEAAERCLQLNGRFPDAVPGDNLAFEVPVELRGLVYLHTISAASNVLLSFNIMDIHSNYPGKMNKMSLFFMSEY